MEESTVVFYGPRSSPEKLLPAHRRLCKGRFVPGRRGKPRIGHRQINVCTIVICPPALLILLRLHKISLVKCVVLSNITVHPPLPLIDELSSVDGTKVGAECALVSPTFR